MDQQTDLNLYTDAKLTVAAGESHCSVEYSTGLVDSSDGIGNGDGLSDFGGVNLFCGGCDEGRCSRESGRGMLGGVDRRRNQGKSRGRELVINLRKSFAFRARFVPPSFYSRSDSLSPSLKICRTQLFVRLKLSVLENLGVI
ncbi:unnamed protein product [Linum trigynum]|uniref:Uncharacterized protein n=1 Tax=Linum trigynum TaxID=586398 RepID=A0AAV2FG91_9ROSI